ncbi:hypothetical protein [Streptomyces sp. NPDC058394]|uniref:hypothetical protein n=1 Tax=unclassified Streptomyces TaxID=2593676 RepID=UPI003662F0E4
MSAPIAPTGRATPAPSLSPTDAAAAVSSWIPCAATVPAPSTPEGEPAAAPA